MAEGISIILNGRERLLQSPGQTAPLLQVLAELELKADRIAVEHNGEIAPRANWAVTEISSGDRLEIVHFVGGGSATRTAAGSTAPRS